MSLPSVSITGVSAADLAVLMGFNIADTNVSAILGYRIASAVNAIKTFLGFDFIPASAIEFYDTFGTEELLLARRFVTSVANVWEDREGNYGQTANSFDAVASLLVAGTDYSVKAVGGSFQSVLYRINGSWPVGWRREATRLASALNPVRGAVKVEYVSGLGTITNGVYTLYPDVIDAIYAEAAANVLAPNGTGVQTSESIGGRSVSITPFMGGEETTGLVSKLAITKLKKYKTFGFAAG